jgi:hypothetical protein
MKDVKASMKPSMRTVATSPLDTIEGLTEMNLGDRQLPRTQCGTGVP